MESNLASLFPATAGELWSPFSLVSHATIKVKNKHTTRYFFIQTFFEADNTNLAPNTDKMNNENGWRIYIPDPDNLISNDKKKLEASQPLGYCFILIDISRGMLRKENTGVSTAFIWV